MPHISQETLEQLSPTLTILNPADITGAVRSSRQEGNRQVDKFIDTRHPEWSEMSADWIKWRRTYNGGDEFVDAFLFEYSRREQTDDFTVRKNLTYNPNHAGALIDIIRNAMIAKLPEVTRKGDPVYEDLMRRDVDMLKSSMTTFIGLEVLPLLLSQGKRFVGVDAPTVLNRAGVRTMADDRSRPYLWAFDAEDMLSWAYDEEGRFRTVLVRETVDVRDHASGLVKGTREQFRYMRTLMEGEVLATPTDGDGNELAPFMGPGVMVVVLDKDDKVLMGPIILDISRIPIVEYRLVESLMKDLADMQIGLLNLNSTDMSFLFRGNFPIYTEQYDETEAHLKPLSSKRTVETFEGEISDRDRVVEEDERPNVREAGSQQGIGYKRELDRPGFINPATENLKASMEKQQTIARDMRALLDISLVSLSVKAVEQSGKSKEADRVGQEAALAYIASVLEASDREIADLFHEFLGSAIEGEVRYPTGFTAKGEAERREEIAELRKLRASVPSKVFAQSFDRRIVELGMKMTATPDEIEAAVKEIETAAFIDDDPQRREAISRDIEDGVLSKKTGSRLRGYEEAEADEAMAEKGAEADMLSGGVNVPPDDGDEGGDE